MPDVLARSGADDDPATRPGEALLGEGALRRALFDSANVSAIATDAGGVIRALNVGAERMLGYAAADVVDRLALADVSDPAETSARARALSMASRGIEDVLELTFIRRDGGRFPAVVSITALRDADDAVVGYLLIGTDNTTRQQAEEARRASEARYRTLFEHAPDGILIADAESHHLDANARMCHMLGYTREELIGLHARDIVGDAETPHIAPALSAINATADYQREWQFRRKDGTVFPASVVATRMPDGNLLATIHDVTEQKRAEARMRRLVDSNAQGVMFWRRDGEVSMANDAFLDRTGRMAGVGGWECDVATGALVWAAQTCRIHEVEPGYVPNVDEALAFFPPEARAVQQRAEAQARRDGTGWDHELPMVTARGRAIWVRTVGAVEMEDGRPVRMIGIIQDITARRQADDERRQSGALQTAIFDSANFSSIATDARGVIQIFNVGAERMLGYGAAEVVNIITPADISDPQELIARAQALSGELGTPITPGFEALVFKASRGIEDIYELTYIRKDGSRFPAVVSVTALRDAQDTIIGYLLIGTDNTARQQIEEERSRLDQRLRDQHFYTRSLIESNNDAMLTTDPRGIITDVNKQTEALTGCTRDELIGAPFRNYFTDAGRAEAGIHRVLNEGTIANYELTARARDGTLTVVSFNATTFHDRDRRLQGVVGAARDMTELKRFEQRLQQKNAELEDASRMKSEFLANMSHELRTPLNSIIGFSEVLVDGLMGELTEKQRGYISDIFRSGNHLLSLINDILDLSKVEAGKMSLDLEPVQISSLFANSLSIIQSKAATRRIHLEMDAPADLGSIWADPRKVKQIVYNLLSNAVKFTVDGGTVRLRARRVPRAAAGRLESDWPGRTLPLADGPLMTFLAISVTDTGIGIAPDALGQLFKPFSQIDSGLARRFEGTGLGLAMVKLLAELHGGTVAVESAVREGSRFTVWLPLRSPEDGAPPAALRTEVPQSATPQPTALQPAAERVRTALVVEDDFAAAELIRMQLEGEGLHVLVAETAEAALRLADRQPLALITLDLLLPDADGWALIGALRAQPALRLVPIIIVSVAADRSRGFALGAAAVIQKPMSRQALHEALVELGIAPLAVGRALRVLIVDDDPAALDLLTVRLEDMGASVMRASSGREGIRCARRELPDLIVLDLMMPDVDGFDVVETLQGSSDTAVIPILVFTAKQVTAEDRVRLDGAVSRIVSKAGFDAERFARAIRRALASPTTAAR